MAELRTKNFHIMEPLKPGEVRAFILDKWEPEEPVKIVGVDFGLLCDPPADSWEMYMCVSYSPACDTVDNWKSLKTDYLFYAQRDAYHSCSGIADLTKHLFLPSGDYFKASKQKPVYIKVGAANQTKEQHQYDALANLYYE